MRQVQPDALVQQDSLVPLALRAPVRPEQQARLVAQDRRVTPVLLEPLGLREEQAQLDRQASLVQRVAVQLEQQAIPDHQGQSAQQAPPALRAPRGAPEPLESLDHPAPAPPDRPALRGLRAHSERVPRDRLAQRLRPARLELQGQQVRLDSLDQLEPHRQRAQRAQPDRSALVPRERLVSLVRLGKQVPQELQDQAQPAIQAQRGQLEPLGRQVQQVPLDVLALRVKQAPLEPLA